MIKRFMIDRIGRRQEDYEWRGFQGLPDMAAVKSILILHTDAKLGDAMINSMLIPAIVEAYPHIRVVVGTTPAFEKYWRTHPQLAEVLVFPERGGGNPLAKLKRIKRAAQPHAGKFDILISFDTFAHFDTLSLIQELGAKNVVGFEKHTYRLFDYSLEDFRYSVAKRHISARVESLLKLFQIDRPLAGLPIHVPFDSVDMEPVEKVLAGKLPGSKAILFNIYGAADIRTLSAENVARIVRVLTASAEPLTVYVSVPASRAGDTGSIEGLGSGRVKVVVVPPLPSLFSLNAFVSRMDSVITPDSGVGHIAAAFGKPTVCLFYDRAYNPIVWMPLNSACDAVISDSGNVNDVPWEELVAALARRIAVV